MLFIRRILIVIFLFPAASVSGQNINWTADGTGYVSFKGGAIVKTDPANLQETVIVTTSQLTPAGSSTSLKPQSFSYSNDQSKLLLFTNTQKVWRYNTRGDYWVLQPSTNSLRQLGKGLTPQSLMFAKFSPDGRYVAYVSDHNIYVEEVSSGQIRRMTNDGSRKMINGTFDWVYEEEFDLRDGFRWSPDGTQIAFWQVDATGTRDYYMLNTTDSVYSRVIPVEYPKVGQPPSPARIGVVNLNNGFIRWMQLDGDPAQHYITRMEWGGKGELVIQQLDRRQQESRLIFADANSGTSRTFWAEHDNAWVDLNQGDVPGFNWVNKGQELIWVSEKDGWRHIYRISRDGKTINLITPGNYDIGSIKAIDEKNGFIYFNASPQNATQNYLYRVRINPGKKTEAEMVTPSGLNGYHNYQVEPGGRMAYHTFSSHSTIPAREFVSLPDHKPLNKQNSIASTLKQVEGHGVEYLQVTTDDNIMLDAWINKPLNFDPNKKYPVVFYIYGEAAASTVNDQYGNHSNFLYAGDMRADGYIQVSIDNRGTPSLKGAGWRKSIYGRNGQLNIQDFAAGAKKILERNYMDKNRVAVWGWSGGGTSTLHLLFRYPELFKTGIAIAPVTNLLYYDNIYTERYMGLPEDNMQNYIAGSAITHAKNLKGNLLLIHGTGDDNVHYSNTEALVNELVKHGKQFRMMAYPNRTHGISEGEGTFEHLSALYTDYLKQYCPPGPR